MNRDPWWLFANLTTWLAVTVHAYTGAWVW